MNIWTVPLADKFDLQCYVIFPRTLYMIFNILSYRIIISANLVSQAHFSH